MELCMREKAVFFLLEQLSVVEQCQNDFEVLGTL